MLTRIKELEAKLDPLKEESETRVDLLNELVNQVGWDDPQRAAALSEGGSVLGRPHCPDRMVS